MIRGVGNSLIDLEGFDCILEPIANYVIESTPGLLQRVDADAGNQSWIPCRTIFQLPDKDFVFLSEGRFQNGHSALG